jgi:hypothetical protein
VTTEGGATGRAVVPHPLVAMIARAERDAAAFGAALGLDALAAERARPKRPKAGRPPGSTPLADLAPASKRLRALK